MFSLAEAVVVYAWLCCTARRICYKPYKCWIVIEASATKAGKEDIEYHLRFCSKSQIPTDVIVIPRQGNMPHGCVCTVQGSVCMRVCNQTGGAYLVDHSHS